MNTEAISMLFTGDFCPLNRIEKLARQKNFGTVFNDFLDVFQSNDLNVIDLECPLTEAETGRPKTGPHQKAHPDTIYLLSHAGIHLAAMANNHMMDYGSLGVRDTLESCREHGIQTVGIGRTPEEAAKPFSTVIKNRKIGILNLADNEFLSTPDGSYHCNPIDPVRNFYDIERAAKDHDYLIVIVHAGNEFYELPSPRTKALYRYMVDLGANAVISHHTHVFSGYETYKSSPIFYGLGNFIYDWPGKRNGPWNRGYVVRLQLTDKTEFEIIPLKQNEEEPGIFHLDSREMESFHQEMLLRNTIIADDQLLESRFAEYCKSIYPMYDAFIEPYFGRFLTALRKRGLFPKFMSRKKRLLLLNLNRCESNRDVVLRMLKYYEQDN